MPFKKAIATAALITLSAATASAHCPTFGGGLGIAGPIGTFSASVLPPGKKTVGLSYQLTGFDRLSAGELEEGAMNGREAHSLSRQQVYSLTAGYGATYDLTVAVQVPYVSRDDVAGVHLHEDLGMAHRFGTVGGLGDVSVFGQYRLLQQGLSSIEFSLIGGVKIPTGETGERENGTRIPTEHQPGSGSWDPFAGFALAHQEGRLSLHLNGLYTVATSGSGRTNLGDRAQLNAAAVYRLGGKANYDECDAVYEYFYPETRTRLHTDLVLEVNGSWQDRLVKDGMTGDSWGGTTVFVSPGIRATLDNKYATYLSVGIPVVQDLNGKQAEADFRLLAGVSVGF